MNELNEKNKETIKTKNKLKDKGKLTARDYITLALMLILVFVVYTMIGVPMGATAIGYIFLHAACSLLWGTIFLLMYMKVNKKWVPLIFGIILAVMQIFNFWVTAVALLLGAVISEIIWQKGDRKSFKTMTICFTVQITAWYLGNFVPLIMMKNFDQFIAERYVEMFNAFREVVAGPLFFVGLLVVLVCCIIGAFIGRQLLKKHFEKAGIV